MIKYNISNERIYTSILYPTLGLYQQYTLKKYTRLNQIPLTMTNIDICIHLRHNQNLH